MNYSPYFWTRALLVAALLFGRAAAASAQEEVLADRNGDGAVSILAFGDSITFGVGEGIEPGEFVDFAPAPGGGGAGYPQRMSALSGLPVGNAGVSGEILTEAGIERFPDAAGASAADIVIIMEGTNDARERVERPVFRRSLQRVVNVARALGKLPMVGTLTPVCCDHAGREPFLDSFNQEIRAIAAVNEIPLVDNDRAWRSTCTSFPECDLLCLPEGLHPNNRGFEVLAQTALGTLFEVDLFAPGGAAELESALGLEPGTVIVLPEAAS